MIPFKVVQLKTEEREKEGLPYLVHDGGSKIPNEVTLQVYRYEGARKRQQRILQGERGGVRYVCTNFGEHSMTQHPVNYAIALLNTEERTITLRDIAWFNTTIQVPTMADADMPVIDEDMQGKRKTFSTSMSLAQAFGSKKGKKMANLREKKMGQKDAVQKAGKDVSQFAALDDKVREMEKGKSKAREEIEEQRRGLLPPYDATAKCLSEAYPFDQCKYGVEKLAYSTLTLVIPKQVYESIHVEDFTDKGQPSQFAWVAERMLVAGMSQERLSRLALMHYLLLFSSLKAPVLAKCSTKKGRQGILIPDNLLDFFIRKFTEEVKGKLMMTAYSKNRLACYICVLAVWIEGERGVLIAPLVKELKLTPVRLQEYFKSVGCKIGRLKVEGETTRAPYATLAFPLTFPEKKLMLRR